MLDADIERRINRARNALVRKVPDLKSQIEQISIALIYKLISDPSTAWPLKQNHFFVNGGARFCWTKIMQRDLSCAQRFELYSTGLQRIGGNSEIPAVIRKILGNARVPYQDAATLARFLEAIDEFSHNHIEQLGDALEYLLSLLGSQGSGGQFRTPSHIREFIVSTLDPKRGESILDPACGTAGFLISAHKHIVGVPRTSSDDSISSRDPEALRGQICGYDISPEMVRLSLANLLLHGFNDPQVFEHDVLASEDHWDTCFDVIFANPPFTTSQTGITSHARFSVAARRTELLFLQYIAGHLTANGRAGVIVPEGMLFQNRGAYQEIRKMLVDNALVAVVSLPAGCFNPYSEVRTSILFLNKSLARSSDTIGLFRANHDGFRLGKLRTRIDEDDLPQIQTEICHYFSALRHNQPVDSIGFHHGQIVSKADIGSDGEFNLTHQKYRRQYQTPATDPRVPLGEVVEFLDYRRRPIRRAERIAGPYPYYGASGVVDHIDRYLFDEPLVLVGEDGAKWGSGEATAYRVTGKYWVNNHVHILRPRRELILDQYLEEVLNECDLTPYVAGVTIEKLNQERLKGIRIPLPPIELQRRIVREIEQYRNAIQEARDSIAQMERKIRKLRARVWSR